MTFGLYLHGPRARHLQRIGRPDQGSAQDHCIALRDIGSWRNALLANDEKNVLVTGVIHRIPLREGEINLSDCSDLKIAIESVKKR